MDNENIKWFVPLHRDQLMSLAAGGFVPASSEMLEEQEFGLQKFSPGKLLAFKGGVAGEILDVSEIAGDTGYTVLCELDGRLIEGMECLSFNSIEGWGEGGTLILEETSLIALLSLSLNLSAFSKIHFRSESDKAGFVSRPFENIPLHALEIISTPSLFMSGEGENQLKALRNAPAYSGVGENTDAVDRNLGAVVALIYSRPETKDWAELLVDSLSSGEKIGEAIKDRSILSSDFEKRCFLVCYTYVMSTNPAEGWQSRKVLSDLYEQMICIEGEESELEMLGRWKEKCTDILDNRSRVTPLTDDHFIVGRAVLLLLLRPDLEDVLASKGSSLSPGRVVRALAVILAGARVGFEELENKYKAVTKEFYGALLKYSLWAKNKRKSDSSFGFLASTQPLVKIDIRESDGLLALYSVILNDVNILDVHESGPPALQAVYQLSEGVGISLDYSREMNSLSFLKEFHATSRKQLVFISPGEKNRAGLSTVRFWSRCMDLSTVSKSKKLTKELALKILERNCNTDLYCRFALCHERSELIVIEDHIVETLDKDELISTLDQVAKAADDFENEVTAGNDQF